MPGRVVRLADQASRGGPLAAIAIDIPIGLPDTGRRLADELARPAIGKRVTLVPGEAAVFTDGMDTNATHRPDDGPAADQREITHYHADYKDQHVDLYTDGTRWAPGDRVRGQNVVGPKPDRSSPSDASDLPPTGEQLLDTAGEEKPRSERFRRELYKRGGDLADSMKNNASLATEVFAPAPTGSHEGTPAGGEYLMPAPHYGMDAGSLATATFVTGVVLDRTIHWLRRHVHVRTEHFNASD